MPAGETTRPARSARANRPARAPRPPSSARRDEILALLVVKTRRLLRSSATEALAARGETVQLYRVLAHLVSEGGSTQIDLATAVGQHPAAISRLLSRLERARLIVRRRDDQDRRNIRVTITAGGRRRCRALAPIVQSAIARVFLPLGAGARRQLESLLREVAGAVSGAPVSK